MKKKMKKMHVNVQLVLTKPKPVTKNAKILLKTKLKDVWKI